MLSGPHKAESPSLEHPEEDRPARTPSYLGSPSSENTPTHEPLPFSFVDSDSVDRTLWSSSRVRVMSVIGTVTFDVVMGVIIMLNMGLTMIETNANARCGRSDDASCKVPEVVDILNIVFLFVYIAEALCRLYAYRLHYFKMAWNLLDVVIIISGCIDLAFSSASNVPNLQVLRVFRVLRLLRTVRLLVFFPELSEIVRGFVRAMKVIFWGVIMILLLLSVWSLLAVEIVHPRNSIDHLNPWCNEAFSSVEKATLYFFQTLVAGDSWGVCAVPIILEAPVVVVVFAGALVSVQLGFTNLILAVIVETAAQARERDHDRRLREKKMHEQDCLEEWHKIIEGLDKDLNGTISLEELKLGFRTQPKVAKVLSLLDIDWDDLEDLFRLMDIDKSGDVSYVEFFHCLRKAHSQDMRMYLMHLKLQLSRIFFLMGEQVDLMKAGFKPRPLRSASDVPSDLGTRRSASDLASETMPRRPDITDGVACENKDIAQLVRHAPFRATRSASDAAQGAKDVFMFENEVGPKATRSAYDAAQGPKDVFMFENEVGSKATGSAFSAAKGSKDPYTSETELGLKESLDLLRSELDSRLDELTRAASRSAQTLDALLARGGIPMSDNDRSEMMSASDAGEVASHLSGCTPVSDWYGPTNNKSPRNTKSPRRVLSLKQALSSPDGGAGAGC